ncbi:MAG: TetR/AcrR family transcriptional regulator [Firmicutes bacterium]|nr:TetR/AcrR family transcriptional regulator [Bacillota bacterium]
MTTRTRRGQQTKEAIFQAALELFSQRGYDAVSIREIAGAVGIKESSIYNHYASKEEILEQIFQFFVARVQSARPSQAEARELLSYLSPEEFLKYLVMQVGKQLGEDMDKAARVIYGEKYRNARAKELYIETVFREPAGYYVHVFALMAELGLIRPVDFELYAEQYNYVLAALTEEYALADDVAPIVKKMLRNADFFARLLQSEQ